MPCFGRSSAVDVIRVEPVHTVGLRSQSDSPDGDLHTPEVNPHAQASSLQLMKFLRENLIGEDATFTGPFGKKKLVYCDYTASGRSVRFIEEFILKYVSPFYGNTHTTTSVASRQTTHFRDKARDIVKRCVNASDDDVVIYAGNGTTGAIHKLIAGLDLSTDKALAQKSIVYVGPYEHHSNILPWKETGAKIIRIKETKHGKVDLVDLEGHIQSNIPPKGAKGLRIVSCSAVSNVTGIITDVDEVARIAHRHGAYVIFDYASGAPYLEMDMNPSEETYKDAIVCSPHKFVGGPGTSGLLISKKHMFRNSVPDHGGGGTVLYVTRDTYAYIKDIEAREEGGTPAIMESIRCGMVFQLKQAIGPQFIAAREEQLVRQAFDSWKKNKSMIILGSNTTRRLPIFAFVVKHLPSGKYIHHNYMSVILNDVFGIQSRGGCACAGPYAEDLLGIAESLAQNFAKFLDTDSADNSTSVQLKSALEIMKPGFCRLNFPYFMDDSTAKYVIEAVNLAVNEGWKLLPFYVNDPETGVWKHRNVRCSTDDTPYDLDDIDYHQLNFGLDKKTYAIKKGAKLNPKKALKKARKLFKEAEKTMLPVADINNNVDELIHPNMRDLVWFLQPRAAYKYMRTESMLFTPLTESEICDNVDDRIAPKMRSLIWFLQPKSAYKHMRAESGAAVAAKRRFSMPFSVPIFEPRRLTLHSLSFSPGGSGGFDGGSGGFGNGLGMGKVRKGALPPTIEEEGDGVEDIPMQ